MTETQSEIKSQDANQTQYKAEVRLADVLSKTAQKLLAVCLVAVVFSS